MSTESAARPSPPPRGEGGGPPKTRPFRLRFHSWIRWLHTYLSMFTFLVVLFFSATGIFLNHPEWTLGIEPRTVEAKGTLDKGLLNGPDWIGIEGALRRSQGLHGIAGEDEADEREASLRFSAPAYTADVAIDRRTGTYTVKTEAQGWLAAANDLHRGKDSGRPWAWTIDLSGAFLLLLSLTGIGMVFFLKKVKVRALLTALAGIVAAAVLIRLASG